MKRIALPVLLLVTFSVACAEENVDRPISEWIQIIQQEADQWYAGERPDFAAIRLAAGWSMPNLSGKPFQVSQVERELPALRQWLDKDGYRLLNQILRDEKLSPEKEPYRAIILGLYLRAGLDYAETDAPQGRALLLNLDKVAGGREACIRYREQVNQAGRKALSKGYLTGRLSGQDIEAIRLYRIAQGQRGVGESFLPAHLGLHPLQDGRLRGSAGSGHGLNHIIALVHGKPYYDFRLRRLEDVLQGEKYSDKLDTSYHLTLSLRPEGVSDFLRVLEGYEPFENEAGAKVVRLKPLNLEAKSGEPADASVRLKDRIGPKPVVLYLNDPIDGPMTEQFPAFETFYQAYRTHVDCWFVAVDIHDWYYSGMQDMLSRDKPDKYPNTHYHNHEERARKMKNRYLESPHATFPCLIGDDWQSVKNHYGTGGGANHWVIIDRDGMIAEYTGNQNGNLNHVETAVRRVLANGCRMAPDSQAHIRWGSPDSAPNVVMPTNKPMRLHNAEVVSVDVAQGEVTVKRQGVGLKGTVQVKLKSFARIARDEVPIKLAQVKRGERVAVDFYLDEYIDTSKAEETKLKAPVWGTWRREYRLGDQCLRMTLLGHYGIMRRRWYLDEVVQAAPIPARGIRVLDATEVANPYDEPSVMWLSGRVLAIDPKTRRVSVERAPISAETARGYGFYQEAKKSGQSLALTNTARLRLVEVEKWLKDAKGEVVVLADDAVDYCLNGEFGGGFENLNIGDFVGVRYYPERQRGDVLVPHSLRISKPIEAKTR
jgi:hypothetical protein